MSVEIVYRVRCSPCGRFLPHPDMGAASEYADDAKLFPTFTDAYDGAVRRGWSAYPLVCPNCAAALKEKVQRVEVRPEGHTEEDGRGLPEGSEGPE